MKNIQQEVEHWLDSIVIGLQLCPFAKRPRELNQIRLHVSKDQSIEALTRCLAEQCLQLEQTPKEQLETTLIIVPELLSNFDDYLDCLYLAEQVLETQNWQGVFQIASFHPEYQFEGTQIDDAENLTNRPPYPIFHLLREDSVSQANLSYKDSSDIPETNKKTMESLSKDERSKLFNYLKP